MRCLFAFRRNNSGNDTSAQDALAVEVVSEGKIGAVRESLDGRTLAVAARRSGSADYSIQIIAAEDGRRLRTLSGHTGTILSLAFHPDGRRLFSGGSDGQLKVWDLHSGQELISLSKGGWANEHIHITPDGKTVATTDGMQRTGNGPGHSGVVLWRTR